MISPFWSFLSHLTLSYQIKVTVIHLRSIFSVLPCSASSVKKFHMDSPKHGGAQLRRHWPLGFLKPKNALAKFLYFSFYLKIPSIIRTPLSFI